MQRAGPTAENPADGIHIFGPEVAAHAAWADIGGEQAMAGVELRPQPTARERVSAAKNLWREGTDGTKGLIGMGLLMFLASVCVAQLVAQWSYEAEAIPSTIPWIRVTRLRWALVATLVIAIIAGIPVWVRKQKWAFAQYPGTRPEDVESFRQAASRPILHVAHILSASQRLCLRISLAAGAVAAGIGLGAMNRLTPVSPISLLLGLAVMSGFYGLWVAVRHLQRRRRLFQGLNALTLLAAVLPFGQFCWYLFYAGMGIAPDEVDVHRIDALNIGMRGLLVPAIVAIVGLATVIVIDRFARALAAVLLAMCVLASTVVVLTNLSAAQRAGRRVALGLPSEAAAGIRFATRPKPRCIAWISEDAHADTGPLPEFGWEVGSRGDMVLLVFPAAAQKANPLPGGANAATFTPTSDVRAPVVSVERNDVRFAPVGTSDGC